MNAIFKHRVNASLLILTRIYQLGAVPWREMTDTLIEHFHWTMKHLVTLLTMVFDLTTCCNGNV